MTDATATPAYTANASLAEAADWLRAVDGPIAVLTHAKPDGDAYGSVLATVAALGELGHDTRGYLVPPIHPSFAAIAGDDPVADRLCVWGDDASLGDPAAVVIVDTGAWAQLGEAADAVRPLIGRTLIIDHHLSGDVPAPRRVIDGQAAAACELVAGLIDELWRTTGRKRAEDREGRGNPLFTPPVARALFAGIASDTGWFRFSNARPATHALAARLIACGVDHAALFQQLEQAERPEKLKLLIRAVASLKLLAGERAAVMTLRARDFEAAGARADETERLIDIPQQVATVEVAALVTESDDGEGGPMTRISFRSKPPMALNGHAPGARAAVNVAELAGRFGGGGHARAAGAKVAKPVDQVLPEIEQAIADAVNGEA